MGLSIRASVVYGFQTTQFDPTNAEHVDGPEDPMAPQFHEAGWAKYGGEFGPGSAFFGIAIETTRIKGSYDGPKPLTFPFNEANYAYAVTAAAESLGIEVGPMQYWLLGQAY